MNYYARQCRIFFGKSYNSCRIKTDDKNIVLKTGYKSRKNVGRFSRFELFAFQDIIDNIGHRVCAQIHPRAFLNSRGRDLSIRYKKCSVT